MRNRINTVRRVKAANATFAPVADKALLTPLIPFITVVKSAKKRCELCCKLMQKAVVYEVLVALVA